MRNVVIALALLLPEATAESIDVLDTGVFTSTGENYKDFVLTRAQTTLHQTGDVVECSQTEERPVRMTRASFFQGVRVSQHISAV